MKQYVIIILALFSLYSCGACKNKKNIITYCNKLEGTDTNIRNLINIDGYYRSSSANIMFFEDGSYVMNVFFKPNATDSLIRTNMSNWVKSWIDNKGLFQWGATWGVYRIEGDTIIAHTVTPGNFWSAWGFDEFRYEIINRTAIKEFYFSVSPMELNSGKSLNFKYEFISCDLLPSSDNFLKENKWIWRHESDWKNYMQMIEQKKSKKK
jgi:hypothetical protein